MNRQEIIRRIQKVIEEQNRITIKNNDERLDMDSFAMMLLVTFIKEEMGVQLDMESLDFDAFTSLNTLADLIEHKGVPT